MSNPQPFKLCTRCNQLKSVDDFPWVNKEKTRRRPYCKPCVLEMSRLWYARNRDHVARYRAKRRNPEREHFYQTKVLYGEGQSEYQERLQSQNGQCAICGSEPGARRFAFGHCHKTGIIRGLLCVKCNRGLGLFKDDPNLLESASKYLRRA